MPNKREISLLFAVLSYPYTISNKVTTKSNYKLPMSAVPRPRKTATPHTRKKNHNTPLRRAPRKVEKLPIRSPQVPPGVRLSLWLQRGCSVLTFTLVSATLIVYAGTVYTQQSWNREYQKLKSLQYQERTLTVANENWKNQLAQQATSGGGLVPASPQQTIFLTPASEPLFKKTPKASSPENEPSTTASGY
ncbi:MAG: hypothetical protein BRC48_16250 [Cyanobacteria bacterium QS_9_48_30]|nr:MAG: hypothetical protein BRC48_16250 [Cyanobacteria bacterium QS_9_48_30]